MADVAVTVGAALAISWLVLVLTLLAVRPKGSAMSEAVRILPDVLRLLRRLAADRALPPGVRTRLGLLLAYLASPIDIVPDFVPLIGYADDVVIVILVLRGVVRQAGLPAVRRHWPGSEDGFTALCRLAGLAAKDDARPPENQGQRAPYGDGLRP